MFVGYSLQDYCYDFGWEDAKNVALYKKLRCLCSQRTKTRFSWLMNSIEQHMIWYWEGIIFKIDSWKGESSSVKIFRIKLYAKALGMRWRSWVGIDCVPQLLYFDNSSSKDKLYASRNIEQEDPISSFIFIIFCLSLSWPLPRLLLVLGPNTFSRWAQLLVIQVFHVFVINSYLGFSFFLGLFHFVHWW